METRVGLVFCGTGGQKMVRALRSFRRMEPDLPVHILFDVSSHSWRKNLGNPKIEWFEQQSNVQVRQASNSAYVNGIFNIGMQWMKELGYTHGCTIHDDVVFSPLLENCGDMSGWFARLEADQRLQHSSGLSLSFMEALVQTNQPGVWQRSPEEWDARDLESESLWQKLCPNGKPAMYFGSEGASEGVHLDDWFVKYFVTEKTCTMSRLGPTGQIVPIKLWEETGGFDEKDGIFYDMEYPIICAIRGLPPVKVIPNIPYIHLHNQSTAFGDPAVGAWGHDLQSFVRKYGKEPGEILRDLGGGGY